jgi:biotin carboxylase
VNTFNAKRLLILGANPETVPLIKSAQAMGVIVIVTDNDPGAFAKPFADKSFNVDGLDVAGLKKLAEQEHVDGVLVGVADRLITPYQQLCEELSLPCYASKKQCEVFTDKQKFNELCYEYEIPTIPAFPLGENFDEAELSDLPYPVFIKPVDGNSGKGMSICNGKDEISAAVEKALAHSNSRQFLVERYMDCNDIFINFTFKDGEFWPSAIADRHTCRTQGNLSRVCLGATYPSDYVDLYYDTLHDKFVRMFKSLEVKNGVLMVSAFIENNVLYVYDPGFRLQGEAPNIPVEAVNGFDQRSMLVEFALSGSMGAADLSHLNDCRFKGMHAATIWFLGSEGVIGSLVGLDELEGDPAVVGIVQRLFVGDEITSDMVGTEAQVVARVYIVCATREDLTIKVGAIQNLVHVYDINEKPMLLEGFNVPCPGLEN